MSDAYKIKDPFGLYFITMQVVYWLDIFDRKIYRDIILDSINYCRCHKNLKVFAYVIMSNHVHLIVSSKTGKLSDAIRDLKKYTSVKIINAIKAPKESRREWLLMQMKKAASKHLRNKRYQLWTHENHAIELNTNRIIDRVVNYIHNNPVKAGIVEKPEDYLYSSARNFSEDYEPLIEIDSL